MFKFFQRARAERLARAEATTTAMLEQLIARIKMPQRNLPERVWRDPYVMTYFGVLIAEVYRLNSAGKDASDQLLAHIWRNLTGQDPAHFARAAAALPHVSKDSVQFKAAHDAYMLLVFMKGKPDLKDYKVRRVFELAQHYARDLGAISGEEPNVMKAATQMLLAGDLEDRIASLLREPAAQA